MDPPLDKGETGCGAPDAAAFGDCIVGKGFDLHRLDFRWQVDWKSALCATLLSTAKRIRWILNPESFLRLALLKIPTSGKIGQKWGTRRAYALG
jgi:hypothetical protein